MSVVVVTGTPGAGKTTVLKRAMEELGDKFKVVNFGDVMVEAAKQKGIVKDRDELRKQSPKVQKEIQTLAGVKIGKMAKDNEIIVDTHCLIMTKEGYLPGLPVWVLDELQPSKLILIEADMEEILERRAKDISRTRDEEIARNIDLHQKMNRAIAVAYAMYTGATVKIIENHELDKAVEDMVRALR